MKYKFRDQPSRASPDIRICIKRRGVKVETCIYSETLDREQTCTTHIFVSLVGGNVMMSKFTKYYHLHKVYEKEK